MRKTMQSEAARGRMDQETYEPQSLISIQHSAAITAVPLDSAARKRLNAFMRLAL